MSFRGWSLRSLAGFGYEDVKLDLGDNKVTMMSALERRMVMAVMSIITEMATTTMAMTTTRLVYDETYTRWLFIVIIYNIFIWLEIQYIANDFFWDTSTIYFGPYDLNHPKP